MRILKILFTSCLFILTGLAAHYFNVHTWNAEQIVGLIIISIGIVFCLPTVLHLFSLSLIIGVRWFFVPKRVVEQKITKKVVKKENLETVNKKLIAKKNTTEEKKRTEEVKREFQRVGDVTEFSMVKY